MTAREREAELVSVLGTLADGVVGHGGRHGLLTLETLGIEIDWWVGADDAWRIPSEGSAHTVRPGVAPAIDARVRVPGGEAVLRGYAVAGERAPLVVAELENASPAPLVIAWVVRAAPSYRIGRVAIDGSTLLIDQRARVELPRAPLRWAVAARATGVRETVLGGAAVSGPFETVVSRRGDLEIALLFPVAHRTRTRLAATTVGGDEGSVARLPGLDDVERGWSAALERGTTVELPDDVMQSAVDSARATVLLALARGRSSRDRRLSRAAQLWDLGAPSARLRGGASRDDPWPRVRAEATRAGSSPSAAAEWLVALRGALFAVERNRISVLPHFPVEWLGRAIAVHDAPTTAGPVSFALRWHGARPALLWEVPEGFGVRAPGLDPAWKAIASSGEGLLAEVDRTRLLPLGTAGGSERGIVIDEPESFS
jgi:hypothetical protein